MNRIVIFDFDKTLTLKDTNLGFFKFAGRKNPLFILRLSIYFVLRICRKFKLISNSTLKDLALSLFLHNKSPNYLYSLSKKYSGLIELNKTIFERLIIHKSEGDRVVIVTASFSSYVKPIFPGIEVIGSEFDFSKSQVKLKFHCYQQEKVHALNLLGINKIDVLYTDSLSDIPLAIISTEINVVKKGEIVHCGSFEEFLKSLNEKKFLNEKSSCI